MTGQSDSRALTTIARQLDESAREHKRSERLHREAARRDRESLRALLAFCEAAGIEVVAEPQEAKHGRPRSR